MKPASTIYCVPFEIGIKRNSKKKIKGSFGHGNVSGPGKKTYYVLGADSPTAAVLGSTDRDRRARLSDRAFCKRPTQDVNVERFLLLNAVVL